MLQKYDTTHSLILMDVNNEFNTELLYIYVASKKYVDKKKIVNK